MFKKIFLVITLIKSSMAMEDPLQNSGEDFSNAIRTNLQREKYFELPYFKDINPAEKFVRLAIEMILESLRLQEMAKIQAVDAKTAINAGHKMFESLIVGKSDNVIEKKSAKEEIQENKEQLKEFLDTALNEKIPEIVKNRALYLTQYKITPPEMAIKNTQYNIETKKNDIWYTPAPNWIDKYLGISEGNLGNELQISIKNKTTQPLTPISAEEVDREFSKIKRNQISEKPKFKIVSKFNCEEYPNYKESINTDDHFAFIQLASQFNYLESPGTEITSVSNYSADRTQGPLTAIQAIAGTIYRDVCVRHGYLEHALIDVLPESIKKYEKEVEKDLESAKKDQNHTSKYSSHSTKLVYFNNYCQLDHIYKNGYLKLYNIPKNLEGVAKDQILQELIDNTSKIKILVQHSIYEKTGKEAYFSCTAAPSYQGVKTKAPANQDSSEGQLCINILVKQYEALAKLAVLKSVESNKCVNLHLVFVGRGAFNVQEYVELPVLNAVAETVSTHNVNVFVHDYIGNRAWTNKNMKFSTEVVNLTKIN